MNTDAPQPRRAGAAHSSVYLDFIDRGVPRIFSWIEWVGFVALLRYVGDKYSIPALVVGAWILIVLLSTHTGSVLSGYFIDRHQNPKSTWGIWLGATLLVLAAAAIHFSTTTLVDTLVMAQRT